MSDSMMHQIGELAGTVKMLSQAFDEMRSDNRRYWEKLDRHLEKAALKVDISGLREEIDISIKDILKESNARFERIETRQNQSDARISDLEKKVIWFSGIASLAAFIISMAVAFRDRLF